MKKLNNQGSSLVAVMIGLMLVSIATAGFIASINGMVFRDLYRYEQKQSYLTARSTVDAIAKSIEEYSHNLISSKDLITRMNMSTLPLQMQIQEVQELNLTQGQEKFLYDLQNLNEGDIMYLDEIQWNQVPDSLDMGTVEVSILRQSSEDYIVKAKATVGNDISEVGILMKGTEHQEDESVTKIPEESGTWNGIYADYGYTILDGALTGQSDNEIVQIRSNQLQGGSNVNMVAAEHIFLVDDYSKTSTFTSNKSIFVQDTVLEKVTLQAKDNIYIFDDSSLSGTLEAEKIYIEGSDILIKQGSSSSVIYAKEIVIKGENITLDIDIKCESLLIEGSGNELLKEVLANDILVLGSENNVIGTEEELEEDMEDTLEKETVTFVPSAFETILRYKPEWAEYLGKTVNLFEMEYVYGMDTYHAQEKMTSGYYYVNADTIPTIIIEEILWNGESYVANEKEYTHLNLKECVEVNQVDKEQPVIIIVKNGQNIYIEEEVDGVCIILEGSAKLYLGQESNKIRVYGDPISRDIDTKITEEIDEIVYTSVDTVTESEIKITEIQSEINKVMESYEEYVNGIRGKGDLYVEGGAIVGTIRITEGDLEWKKVSYPQLSTSYQSQSTVLNTANVWDLIQGTGYQNQSQRYILFEHVEYTK